MERNTAGAIGSESNPPTKGTREGKQGKIDRPSQKATAASVENFFSGGCRLQEGLPHQGVDWGFVKPDDFGKFPGGATLHKGGGGAGLGALKKKI